MERPAKSFALLLAATLVTTVVPAVSQAQVVDASHMASSKAAAILGGAPSALELLKAQQGDSHAVLPAAGGSMMRPAMLSASRPTASATKPDIFNSVALALGRSPLDARFRTATAVGAGSAATAFASSLADRDIFAKLEAVNAYVNAHVRFQDDSVQFGVADRWMGAAETLSRGRGDCEDFALAKRAMLRAAGVPDRDLYLVVLRDLTRRADHSVLVVRAKDRFLVLDNGTNRIVDSADVTDYKPIFTFTAGHVWTHGYRRDEPVAPVIMAAAPSQSTVRIADMTVEPASNVATTSAASETAGASGASL